MPHDYSWEKMKPGIMGKKHTIEIEKKISKVNTFNLLSIITCFGLITYISIDHLNERTQSVELSKELITAVEEKITTSNDKEEKIIDQDLALLNNEKNNNDEVFGSEPIIKGSESTNLKGQPKLNIEEKVSNPSTENLRNVNEPSKLDQSPAKASQSDDSQSTDTQAVTARPNSIRQTSSEGIAEDNQSEGYVIQNIAKDDLSKKTNPGNESIDGRSTQRELLTSNESSQKLNSTEKSKFADSSDLTNDQVQNQQQQQLIQISPIKSLHEGSIVSQFDAMSQLEMTLLAIDLKESKAKKIRQRISVGAGVNYLMNRLTATELVTDNRRIKEEGLMGYSASLQYGLDVSPKWSINISASYDQFKSKLDYYDSRDTIVNRNVHVLDQINSLTGDRRGIYEYQDLDALAWNQVIHKNTYTYFTTTIFAERQLFSSKTLSLHAGGGVNLNYLHSSNGKMIRSTPMDNLLYEVQRLEDVKVDKFGYGVAARLGMSWDISQRSFINLSVESNYDLSSKKVDADIRIKPVRFRSLVSVGRRF